MFDGGLGSAFAPPFSAVICRYQVLRIHRRCEASDRNPANVNSSEKFCVRRATLNVTQCYQERLARAPCRIEKTITNPAQLCQIIGNFVLFETKPINFFNSSCTLSSRVKLNIRSVVATFQYKLKQLHVDMYCKDLLANTIKQ